MAPGNLPPRIWFFALCLTVGCTTAVVGGVPPPGGDGGAHPPGGFDAGVVVSTEINPCPTIENPPGQRVDFDWPNPSNSGHRFYENQTVRFSWSGDTPHNVIQLPLWRGQAAPLGKLDNAGWPLQLTSGAPSTHGTLDWHTGASPCGWRPGLYYLADERTPSTGITAVALTVPEFQNSHFERRSCRELADPKNFRARYASYASRPDCHVWEVNNFQTEDHYDWVPATFGAKQGDLVVFRWTGLHNVVQVHDQSKDQPVPGGIFSGPRTNCVGGPNYGCVNGGLELGEFLLDTTNYRPGMIHISDQCAYSCEGCPWDCDNVTDHTKYTGTPFLLALRRAEKPEPVQGSCCPIDPTKGRACRLVELYNDNEGTQFDTGLGGGLTVNRGDLVRFRWSGAVRIAQTKATTTDTGVPGRNPMPGGAAMPASIECVPGPDWTCLGGNTEQAQFIVDVDRAMRDGKFERFSYGGSFLSFFAFADNSLDPYDTIQDSGILLPIAREEPYVDNPPCP